MQQHLTRARGRDSSPPARASHEGQGAPEGRPLGSTQKRDHLGANFAWRSAADEALRLQGLCTTREAMGGLASVYALQKTTRSIVRSVIVRPLEAKGKHTADERKLHRTANRWARCRWNRISPEVTPVFAPDRHAAYWRGLETCGSYSACPCCARVIQQRRRMELGPAVDRWVGGGGGVLMLTLTIPHDFTQGLGELMAAFGEASQALWRGKARDTMTGRFGYVGRVRAWEVTLGQNGWHPHQHILLFFDAVLSAEKRAELQAWFVERWTKLVAASGLIGKRPLAARVAAVRAHGVDLRDGANASSYLAKALPLASSDWGLAAEVTMAQAKKGRKGSRTWIELVQDAQGGDGAAAMAWAEYAIDFRGIRCLTWSRGLRDRLGVGAEVEDEELAEEGQAEAGEVVGDGIPSDVWRVVQQVEAKTGLRLSIRGELLADFATTKGDPWLMNWRLFELLAAYGTGEQKAMVAMLLEATFQSLEPEPLDEAPEGLGLDRRR